MLTPEPHVPGHRSRWQKLAFRSALGALSVSAVVHAAATSEVVRTYRISDLDEVAEREAVIVWLMSVFTFISAPAALGWSARLAPEFARPLQAYAGAVTAALAAFSLPVALKGKGLAGLRKLPQPVIAGALTALIVAGRTRRPTE